MDKSLGIKSGFKITPDNVDHLITGSKAVHEDKDKVRIIKNLYFDGVLNEQNIKRLTKIWW